MSQTDEKLLAGLDPNKHFGQSKTGTPICQQAYAVIQGETCFGSRMHHIEDVLLEKTHLQKAKLSSVYPPCVSVLFFSHPKLVAAWCSACFSNSELRKACK